MHASRASGDICYGVKWAKGAEGAEYVTFSQLESSDASASATCGSEVGSAESGR